MQAGNVIHLNPVINAMPHIPDTDLSALVAEALSLSTLEPRIIERIERDLDAHGIEKKKERIEDQAWLASHNKPLPGLEVDPDENWLDGLTLGAGRPRMPAVLVLVFLMIRCYFGGFKNRKTITLLLESKTVETVLMSFGFYRLPGLSTILEDVNAVATTTLEFILDAQIRQAVREGLDDFLKLTFDSTKVRANSAWPTESALIAGLSERALHLINRLRSFGIVVRIPKVAETLLAEIKATNLQIQFLTGKKNSNKKRAKLYRRIYRKARKLVQELGIVYERAEKKAAKIDCVPSQKRAILTIVDWISIDIKNLKLTVSNSERRINKGEKVDAEEKFLSLADEDAAMIVKGGREPVLGYKPQLGRSAQGFVTSIIVPEGNAADSGQLEDIVETSMARTGVMPELLSFDDGYTNSKAREHYQEIGIEISFSGAKGKNVTPPEDYESDEYKAARNDRSAVESLMFVLKHNHDFEDLKRRGIEAARSELLEKVLAYNAFRTIYLRSKRRQAKLAS